MGIPHHPTLSEYAKYSRLQSTPCPGLLWRHCRSVAEPGENRPLVSVVTIVKNARLTIERTIVSVLAQTYKNIEYIVVDGGSTDGTLDIIAKYRSEIDCCWCEADEGISDAFNKGIALSSGELIALISSDDWCEPWAVQEAVNCYDPDRPVILHGQVRYWNDRGHVELVEGSRTTRESPFVFNHQATFVPRVIYEQIGLFRKDFRFAMDYEWMMRARGCSLPFQYVEACLTNVGRAGTSCIHWKESLAEVWLTDHFYFPSSASWIRYYFYLVKGTISKILLAMGMEFIVRYYHKNFSAQKRVFVSPVSLSQSASIEISSDFRDDGSI